MSESVNERLTDGLAYWLAERDRQRNKRCWKIGKSGMARFYVVGWAY